MILCSEAFVSAVRALPGAEHSFLKQLCRSDLRAVREAIARELERLPPAAAEGLASRLASLDNRRFFQAFAELLALVALVRAGWEVVGHQENWWIRRESGEEVALLVLGFIHAGRPVRDRAERRRLARALTRVRSRRRFACFLRRPLPAGHDPEPVRRVVERWLRQVEQGGWKGRFAAYEDGGVALEFALVDGPPRPGSGPLASIAGPFVGGLALDHVERRLVNELDRFRLGPRGQEPVLPVLVGDGTWPAGEAGWRTLLYGRPARCGSPRDGGAGWEMVVSEDREPALFKDPLYRETVGLIRLGRLDAMLVDGVGWSNPLASRPLRAHEVPTPLLGVHGRSKGEGWVLRWAAMGRPPLDLLQEA